MRSCETPWAAECFLYIQTAQDCAACDVSLPWESLDSIYLTLRAAERGQAKGA